ncbi:class I adenylate-forming enzyme family protein [Microbacterium sp.]|uniref:class I adenylate-forming enzyme family protein n=1 Tax=Microbacterium sp. TaxID=51671 RepID=UPI0037C9BBE9
MRMSIPVSDGEWSSSLERELAVVRERSIWSLLANAAMIHADQDAVVMGETRLTYAELHDRAVDCSRDLSSLGVQPGDRVAYMMPSSPDWAVLHYAIARLGAVSAPVNLDYSAREIAVALKGSQPSVLVVSDDAVTRPLHLLAEIDGAFLERGSGIPTFPSLRQVLVVPDGALARGPGRLPGITEPSTTGDEPPRVSPEDAALIISTSGSTSAPKSAVVSHRGIVGTAAASGVALSVRRDDRFLLMFPNFHVLGAVFLAMTAAKGASTHLLGRFAPGLALDTIQNEKCTVTFGLNTHFAKLMADPAIGRTNVSSLDRVGAGGSEGIFRQIQKTFDPSVIVTSWGCTELSSWGTLSAPARIPTDHGRPLPGMELRICDPETGEPLATGSTGEIAFRGWSVFLGYLRPDGSLDRPVDSDGFFHGGDLGFINSDGHLEYVGRMKMMVKSGGENVSELEVESFLEEHIEGVRTAYVVGAPDPVWGEAIVAFVQVDRGDQVPTNAELREACRGQLAGFKIPKLFIPVDVSEWPLLPNAKIDKHALRRRAATEYAAAQKPRPS